MNKIKVLGVIFALSAVLTVALFYYRPKTESSGQVYVMEPVQFVFKPNGEPGAAAVIQGKVVSEQELQERSRILSDLISQENKMPHKLNLVQHALIKTRQFRERLKILRDLLMNQLLNDSAKAQNLPIERFIEEKILKGSVQVTVEEINDFALKNGIAIGKNASEMQNRLQPFVLEKKRNAAIDAYMKQNYDAKIEIYFSPPSYVFPIIESKLLIRSEDPGATTILVFSNWQCAPCLQLAKNLLELREKYKNQIRIGYVNLFAPQDRESRLVAEAAFCVNWQKHDDFWSFFEAITTQTRAVDEVAINEAAKKTGADTEAFRSCLLKQQFKDEVEAQLKFAADFGVLMTPTVIVGSQVFSGTVTIEELIQAIEQSRRD